MVCVAAFIILVILSLSLPIVWLFNRKLAKSIWNMLKKSWGCVGKRLTFRKCDTNFKDDIKNKLLRKVVFKKPKLVKPIGIGIEIAGVLVVVIFVWSVLEVVKGGLAMVAFGTCNVASPNNCVIGSAESCAIDGGDLNWFQEWGEIFAMMPSRFRAWNVEEFIPSWENAEDGFDAIDIFDPGCVVCRKAFEKQLESGFFEERNVLLLPYVIMFEGEPMFHNSEVVVRFLVSVDNETAWKIIHKLFMEENEKGVNFQEAFNGNYSHEEAEAVLMGWLREFGMNAELIRQRAWSDRHSFRMSEVRYIVEQLVRTRKIPTMIYDGRIRFGL
ncbi:hypothetical protein FWH09_02715 [Candidatus Saccharibacteria bacterium]|nr:hypothetical protein [Candidatus Saccharibacteria bacterium]